MTGEQICETIAWVHEAIAGESRDPRTIWGMSGTGELWPVLEAFDMACVWIAAEFDHERLTFDVADNGDIIERRVPLAF